MLKVSYLTLYCARHCMQSALTGSSVLQVDQRLQTKVFLAGMSVSLADLVMFATLYRALVSLKCNLDCVHFVSC